ncbi:MAG: hypothetical protein LV480_01110 [Methylacidiphilales bacterium]|nr:hypothetical protein [Candidatus Methylacidiphilales bacterium]
MPATMDRFNIRTVGLSNNMRFKSKKINNKFKAAFTRPVQSPLRRALVPLRRGGVFVALINGPLIILRMLQAYSFHAEPIPGHALESGLENGRGFIIADMPDVEAFLRDRLGERGLAATECHFTDRPAKERLSNLPNELKSDLENKGWCIMFVNNANDEPSSLPD